jgi:pyrimidine operon attenuation protein/uracil phosphoribosyltransferase
VIAPPFVDDGIVSLMDDGLYTGRTKGFCERIID